LRARQTQCGGKSKHRKIHSRCAATAFSYDALGQETSEFGNDDCETINALIATNVAFAASRTAICAA
jgi:hypothetical protein